ncbi:MAG TPA: TIGR04372 family glycosyltransferase [Rhodospirillales bacterium]|nr:TIGR04372 family glycosyltransferase [Rhodospirillales bacterium]
MKQFLLRLITRLSFSIAQFLLKHGVILVSYGDAFGHQVWNIEHHSRKYHSLFGKFPKVVAFQKSANVPNKALMTHHRKHGVWIFSSNNTLSRIFYYSRTKWSEQRLSNTARNDEVSNLVFCRYSMNDLHIDTDIDEHVAFPFTSRDEHLASQYLESEDLKKYQYFCFHDRTHNYKLMQSEVVGSKYSDSEHFEQARNTSLDLLYPCAELMLTKGLQSVRLGAYPEQPVTVDSIKDYASNRSDQNDFSDLALMNYCKFFVGPNSGIWLFARSFNRPTCLVNVFPSPWINVPMSRDSVVVPKKLWHTSEKRYLTIKEMMEMETRFYWKRLYEKSFFESLSIEVIENSAEDICGAVSELNDRLDGNWTGPDYRVADYLTKENIGHRSKAYISAFFVEENKDVFTH